MFFKSQVQSLFKLCGQTNTVVGLNVSNDVKSLELEPRDFNLFDLQGYYGDDDGPYSARTIANGVMKMESFQCEVHSAISDARFTRDIFFKKRVLESEGHAICPKIVRIKAPRFVIEKNDLCKCKRNPYN